MSRFRFALSCLGVLACSGSGIDASGRATAPLEPARRDSAGIAILEHSADALERAPLITIDSVPLAVFAESADDPSQDISQLYPQLITGAGEFVGFDYNQRSLLVLGPASGQRRHVGRGGEGPNELGRGLAMAIVAHDTLILGDGSNIRIAIGHPDTGVVRTHSLAEVRGGPSATLLGRTSTGLFLLQQRGVSLVKGQAPQNGLVRRGIGARTWRVGSDSLVELFSMPERWIIQAVSASGGTISYSAISLPLSAVPQLLMWRDEFLVAVSEAWRLERHDSMGVLRTLVRVNSATIAVDDAVYRRYIGGVIRAALDQDPSSDTAKVRMELNTREHAPTVPAFGEVFVTSGGIAWVLDYRFPGDSGWAATAIHHDGRILGRIVEASGNAPIAFGDDRLAFRTEDDDGIATLTIKRIRFN